MKLIRFEQPQELLQLGATAGLGGGYRGRSPIGGSLTGPGGTSLASPSSPTSLFGNPQTFTAAANQQASDYDRIMQSYQDLVKNFGQNPITATNIGTSPVTPSTSPYTGSSDVTSSLSKLSDLATTGGYSGADIANIRARDISPIRSIYANAQQEVERQRALAGGYSPNFNAVQAQMARDEAQQIADTTTNVEAGIAQNVAQNRLAAATPYASASAAENQLRNQTGLANAQLTNQVNLANQGNLLSAAGANQAANLQAQLANRQSLIAPIQGQTNLYGTTPALTSTFGNQVTQAAGIGQNQQNIDNQRRNSVLNSRMFG